MYFSLAKNNPENNVKSQDIVFTSICYYENFYFEQVGVSTGVSREEFLANFATIGIKINLENLEVFQDGKYKKEIEKFMKPKSSKCDKFNTKAIVYPKRPYGKNDYELEVNLECQSSK